MAQRGFRCFAFAATLTDREAIVERGNRTGFVVASAQRAGVEPIAGIIQFLVDEATTS